MIACVVVVTVPGTPEHKEVSLFMLCHLQTNPSSAQYTIDGGDRCSSSSSGGDNSHSTVTQTLSKESEGEKIMDLDIIQAKCFAAAYLK